MIPLASEWQPLPIKDLPIEVIDGDRSDKYPTRSEFRSSGVPFLNSSIIIDNRLFIEDGNFISHEKFEQIKKGRVQRGDIVVTTRGNGVGKTAFFDGRFPTALINAQMLILRAKPDQLDPRFLYFQIISPAFQRRIWSYASGSAQPQIPIRDFRDIHLDIPDLETQRKIAGILSAYDDLIENNQRRIRILEEMPRAIYREWFVNFRFPGHQKVPLVDSPLGAIPKGWNVKSVPECVEIDPRVSVPREGEKPFVPMGSLANNSMLITDIETRTGNSGSKFQNGDTLFARITPCLENGKTGFVQFLPNEKAVACGSTEFIVLRSLTLTPEFVYCLARSEEFRGNAIKSMTGASGRQRVQERCFDRFLIVEPPRTLLDRFSAIVAPSLRFIQNLHVQTTNLCQSRDLLLPRLLGGQVRLWRSEK
jgi:type I restriction enzyme, S subunit